MTIELCGCAIINEKEELLLLWKYKQQHYEFPGGKIEPGESREDAARREAREELGVEVELLDYAGAETFHLQGNDYRSHKYLARITVGTHHVVEKDKFDHLRWIPIKEYANYIVAPNVKSFCQKHSQKL